MTDWRHCDVHPDVNGERMWGCPDCVAELRRHVSALRDELIDARTAIFEAGIRYGVARRSLLAAGYTYDEGSDAWKPPLGDWNKTSALLADADRYRKLRSLSLGVQNGVGAPTMDITFPTITADIQKDGETWNDVVDRRIDDLEIVAVDLPYKSTGSDTGSA